jgi:predicted acylesterase/phospholipase RssA
VEDEGKEDAYLFRTYRNTATLCLNPGPPHKHEIWKVARATSAADTYFDPIEISGKHYYDGGIGNNNPGPITLDEVTEMSPTGRKEMNNVISVFVSIGTGQKRSARQEVKKGLKSFVSVGAIRTFIRAARKLKGKALEAEEGHKNLERTAKSSGFINLFRWHGGQKIGELKLDKWHSENRKTKPPTQTYMDEKIEHYMEQEQVQADIKACAKILVDRRRARIIYDQDNGRWRRFSHCTLQKCSLRECPFISRTRGEVVQHINENHNDETDEFRDRLCRRIKEVGPRYPGGPL